MHPFVCCQVYLREAAEAEVTAMRTAVLQHTEALKAQLSHSEHAPSQYVAVQAAADDDEATRTEMAEQVENLRKEVGARQRNQPISLE